MLSFSSNTRHIYVLIKGDNKNLPGRSVVSQKQGLQDFTDICNPLVKIGQSYVKKFLEKLQVETLCARFL